MMSIQGSSSSYTSTSSSWKYDVFISFRGEDTRNNFTDHLYATLTREGINAFIDDKGLERGKPILELFQAIEESKFLIVIFSKNYASSTWCLNELVKIVECIDNPKGQRIIPIFYDVDPSVVRKQKENFHEAFAKHEETFRENMDMVKAWREALLKVTNISGWDAKDRKESELIQDIAKDISSKIIVSRYMNDEGLVGLDSCLEELQRLIDIGSSDVRMIGICGMGGIGKTAIAKAVYNLILHEFEGASFLDNVRESWEKRKMVELQKQLFREILRADISISNVDHGSTEIRKRLQHKKVLIVIDDVVNIDQLNDLARKHEWFGSGSRIIITTRNEHLLLEVDKLYKAEVYKAKLLNDYNALQLFSLKAFQNNHPPTEYLKLSKSIVNYAGGLPLALKVLGSFLRGRKDVEWERALERTKRDSKKEIIDRLQIGFDGLEETEKKIFLDIACFFKGKHRDYVTRILDACDFSSTIGISVLVEKSLIDILEYNQLWMHDLIQEMGRQIVKKESQEPGKRSRLWEEADIRHVLRANTGTEIVEGIMIEDELNLNVSAKAFSKMINLRLLKIKNVQLPEGLEYLSNKLCFLEWHGYPLRFLPSSLDLDKIVELKLNSSRIQQLQKGINHFNRLTSINLMDCQYLIEIPDLTCVPNLKHLDIWKCPTLREIRSHFVVHEKLISLNVRYCGSLTTLPSKILMESLEEFFIYDCPKLKEFPEIVGSMKRTRYLSICGTAIKHMPLSIELLTELRELNLRDNKNLMSLPSTINGLKSLRELDLYGCFRLENVLETLVQVKSLTRLHLGKTSVIQPTSSIFLMKNLELLSFQGCKGSKPWYLQLPVNLMPRRSLDAMALNRLRLPSLSCPCSIKNLDLRDCNLGEGEIPSDIFASLFSLEVLNLSDNNFSSLPATIKHLLKLRYIYLNDCKRLQSLPVLPSSTYQVKVDGCASLETIPNGLKSCYSGSFYMYCISCYKLFRNNSLMLSMLKDFLKATSSPGNRFSLVVPKSEIPKWVRYQSEGSSITIERPPDLYDNKLVGYVVCSVFAVPEGFVPISLYTEFDGSDTYYEYALIVVYKCGHVSKHLWLIYCRPFNYILRNWPNKYKHIKFYFMLSNPKKLGELGEKVKKCGVHPIYEQDMKDFDPMNQQSSSSSSRDLNEFPQDFVGSTIDVSTTKRNLADSDNEEPEPQIFKKFKFS